MKGINKGRKLTADQILAIKERNTGSKNSFYGKKHSKESIDKIKNSLIETSKRRRKPVQVNGKDYLSVFEAADDLDTKPDYLRRLANGTKKSKNINAKYINHEHNKNK